MALLNNPALSGSNNGTTKDENIFTAQQTLNAPKKVSSRPVEPEPVKFDEEEAAKMMNFAKANAATGSVSNNSLVQTQLNNVLAADGPLLKRARTDGMNSAAERGLNNTSMGVQAGEEAMIRQALSIATPDAQTYGDMDRANLASASQASLAGINQSFADYNQKKQNAFTTAENNIDRNQKDDLFDRGNEFSAAQQDKQNEFASKNSLESDNRRLAGEKEIAAFNAKSNLDLYDVKHADDVALENQRTINAINQNHQSAIAQVMSNPSITPSQANAAIKSINETTKMNLNIQSNFSGVDLSAYMPKGTVTGTSTTDKKGVVTNTFNYVDESTPSPVSPPSNNTAPIPLSEAEARRLMSRSSIYN